MTKEKQLDLTRIEAYLESFVDDINRLANLSETALLKAVERIKLLEDPFQFTNSEGMAFCKETGLEDAELSSFVQSVRFLLYQAASNNLTVQQVMDGLEGREELAQQKEIAQGAKEKLRVILNCLYEIRQKAFTDWLTVAAFRDGPQIVRSHSMTVDVRAVYGDEDEDTPSDVVKPIAQIPVALIFMKLTQPNGVPAAVNFQMSKKGLRSFIEDLERVYKRMSALPKRMIDY